MEKAVEYTRKNSSLKWYDYLYMRVMERFKGVNELSIEAGDMEDLLKKNEYLDIKDFVDAADQRDREAKAAEEQRKAAALGRRGR